MKKFNVYKHPTLGYSAIKQGISWPAFFIPAIWLLYKKQYIRGISSIFFLVSIVFIFKNSLLSILMASIFFRILVSASGNGWLEFEFIGTDYTAVETVEAESVNQAIAKF